MPLTMVVILLCAAAVGAWVIKARRVREIPEHQPEPSNQSQKLASHIRSAEDTSPKQPYDAFLVVDVEGTCNQTAPWGYPNEIIVRTRLTLQMCHMLIHGSRSGMAGLSHAVDGQAKRTCLSAHRRRCVPELCEADLATSTHRVLHRADGYNTSAYIYQWTILPPNSYVGRCGPSPDFS
jgi:hypothetical protein